MASNRDEQKRETHFKIMRLLSENPKISTREIARRVGISNGSAYYCLTALVERGLVKLGNFSSSRHKERYAYILTPKGIREKSRLTYHFLERKKIEFEQLRLEIEMLEEDAGSINTVAVD